MATLYGPSRHGRAEVSGWIGERVYETQTRYLTAYARLGTRTQAADVAGVSLRAVEHWFQRDTMGFRERFRAYGEQAFEDSLESKLLERATDDNVKNPAYLLTAVRARIRAYGTIEVNIDDRERATSILAKLAEGIGRFTAIDTTSVDAPNGAPNGAPSGAPSDAITDPGAAE